MNNGAKKAYEMLAAKAGLTFDPSAGVIYGQRNGFNVIVYAADGNYPYIITAKMAVSRAGGPLGKDVWKGFAKEHKPVQNVKNENNDLRMVLSAVNNAEKFSDRFIEAYDALTGFLAANGYINCCQVCGQSVDTAPYFVSGEFSIMCPDCAAKVSQNLQLSNAQQSRKKDNLIAGIVGALIGSLIGVLCIVVIGQLGYVAALSGIVMAVCTLKGYELLGGKLSTKGIVVSIVLMLVMTYVGNLLEWAIVVMRELEYDFLYSIQLVPILLREQIIEASSYWGGLALVYVFVILGAVPVIRNIIVGQKTRGQMFRIGSRY